MDNQYASQVAAEAYERSFGNTAGTKSVKPNDGIDDLNNIVEEFCHRVERIDSSLGKLLDRLGMPQELLDEGCTEGVPPFGLRYKLIELGSHISSVERKLNSL